MRYHDPHENYDQISFGHIYFLMPTWARAEVWDLEFLQLHKHYIVPALFQYCNPTIFKDVLWLVLVLDDSIWFFFYHQT